MRTIIAVGLIDGQYQPVLGVFGTYAQVMTLIHDRQANGLSFPSEKPIRLPRRLGVDRYRIGKIMLEPYLSNPALDPPYLAARHLSNGRRDINVY
jgi:hypothetical protein